jgi:hypothetical protein
MAACHNYGGESQDVPDCNGLFLTFGASDMPALKCRFRSAQNRFVSIGSFCPKRRRFLRTAEKMRNRSLALETKGIRLRWNV